MANAKKPTPKTKPKAATKSAGSYATDFQTAFHGKEGEWLVREPQTTYGHWASVIGNLTGELPPENEAHFIQVRNVVHKGIHRKAFDRIRDGMGISTDELSVIAAIPKRTLSRREKFSPDETERLLRVASVLQKAVEVLEDLERARRWLSSPKRALGRLTPLQCCDTDAGAEEVEHLLGRIEDGVFS